MNCALLLVATSVCAWADPAPATAVVAPPVAGCTSCATPCSECKPGFLERLKAKFAHHSDCGCAPAPVHIKTCSTCEPSLWERLKASFPKKECGCAPAPTPCYHPAPTYHQPIACGCGESWKPGFLDKLKARFAKPDCGCSTCGTIVTGTTPIIVPAPKSMEKAKETIPGPKDTAPEKLPSTPPGKEISTSSLRLDPVSPSTGVPDPF